MSKTRRDALFAGLGLTTIAGAPMTAVGAVSVERAAERPGPWRRTLEGQRRADLGDGTYLNPVMAGDNPDPSILKDGDAYYKVSSSFNYYPGLLVWKSHDLVNWSPVGPALHKVIGSIYAPDLVKVEGRYFIYVPGLNIDPIDPIKGPRPYGATLPPIGIYVLHADRIEGPWSDPINLGIANIDPGHAVGEDGKRYLFLAGGFRVRLSDDGLSAVGPQEKVMDGWPIPSDWVVEGFALEGPKLLRRGDWFYAFAAEGGTAGPPTSHMVVVSRSRSINGPWETCPHNPIVHTRTAAEPWWSRGHATPVEGPHGDWWLVYHGYENGFRTLGRQMLLEPMTWDTDGWPRALGGDLSRPMRKPAPTSRDPHGMALSDDFTVDRLGSDLTVYQPTLDYRSKVQMSGGTLRVTGAGTGVRDAAVVAMNAPDRSYAVTVRLELQGGAAGGLLLFYSPHAFCGITSNGRQLSLYKVGEREPFASPASLGGARPWLRAVNDDQVVSFFISEDGQDWRKVVSYEVAGYNHNVFNGFLSLRPALCAIGDGQVAATSLSYQAA